MPGRPDSEPGAHRPPRGPVAAFALTTTAGYGVLFYSFGVLLVPMQHSLGWSRSFLSGAFSAGLVVSALLTVPVGRWLDRRPARPLFLGAGTAAAVLVAAWAASGSRLVFAAVWVGLGACQAVLFYDAAFVVLAKRYRGQERNAAITTVTLLAGLASTIFAPAVAGLDAALGWRGAVGCLAGLTALVCLPAFALGLRPSQPRSAEPPPVADAPHHSVLPRQALAEPSFWLLTAAYVLSAVTTFGVAVHLVPFLKARGMSTAAAAMVLGAVGLVQVLGRSCFIKLSARRPTVRVATWVLAAKGVGLVALLAIGGPPGLVVFFVAVYGSANGIATLTRATTVAEMYGPSHYGAIAGVIASLSGLAGALAPYGVAVGAGWAGGDRPVFFALAALSVLAAGVNHLAAQASTRAGEGIIRDPAVMPTAGAYDAAVLPGGVGPAPRPLAEPT
ncbi:MAG TPA: MFS transporter [Acidimicrobiales bacterium]|nr:MFS transporter [Acidimicrobiales bacterium]